MGVSVKRLKKKTDFHILDSVLSGVIVLYATYLIENFSENKLLLSILFILMAGENAIRLSEGRRTRTQRFCVMALYLVGAALILIMEPFHMCITAAAAVEFLVLLFNRVTAILKKPKRRVILLNILCIVLLLVIAVTFFVTDIMVNSAVEVDLNENNAEVYSNYVEIAESLETLEDMDASYAGSGIDMFFYILLMMLILFRLIVHVVSISVSQMKLRILMNIIRETYVLEILLGLLLMIIACSTIFSTLEGSMSNYGDALWYCFALVTTIGFGDITATTAIGRILSVFLGIYGIVVVAIITSVIVNYYGEMRRISKPQGDGEDQLSDAEES